MASLQEEALPSKSCLFYLSSKGCRNGKACQYLHLKDACDIKTPLLCRFDNSRIGCLRGVRCYFRHNSSAPPVFIQHPRLNCEFKRIPTSSEAIADDQVIPDQIGLSKLACTLSTFNVNTRVTVFNLLLDCFEKLVEVIRKEGVPDEKGTLKN